MGFGAVDDAPASCTRFDRKNHSSNHSAKRDCEMAARKLERMMNGDGRIEEGRTADEVAHEHMVRRSVAERARAKFEQKLARRQSSRKASILIRNDGFEKNIQRHSLVRE
eukprot:TRINITY_DN4222_c0_g1_i1.p3 TRINITY_DN4222_c0_g1~~TRINITY_DN4222_c0_g1_i1.p3  ORF type:complete len:110 (-),score=1.00 TRINITY_DN4222_c0_g1_i1:553-882(-)